MGEMFFDDQRGGESENQVIFIFLNYYFPHFRERE